MFISVCAVMLGPGICLYWRGGGTRVMPKDHVKDLTNAKIFVSNIIAMTVWFVRILEKWEIHRKHNILYYFPVFFVLPSIFQSFFYQGFNKIGWYSGLREKYPNAVPDIVLLGNTTCGIPRHDSFQLLRDPLDSDLPWPGFLFGQTTASIWYWCADQVSGTFLCDIYF